MIRLARKRDCCGCSACSQICPKKCIVMTKDSEGFLYPLINTNDCIKCDLCSKVCPILNQQDKRSPINVYAVKHRDDCIRQRSSSGGVFSLLAQQVIHDKGVVFGVKYNSENEAIFSYTETMDGLSDFQGSKYVQAYVGNSYADVESFLKSGRLVLFVGTPCQVLGLKLFLRKEYQNLLVVDFVCHGVPSPKVWRMYLNDFISSHKAKTITSINFRDKFTGWQKYSCAIEYTDGNRRCVKSTRFDENEYMKAFLSNVSLRKSCYYCPTKAGKSMADITIGDFWGIGSRYPAFDDDKGVSLAVFYSDKVLPQCDMMEVTYEDVLNCNYCLEHSASYPKVSRFFFFVFLRCTNSFLKTAKCFVLNKPVSKLLHLIDKIINRVGV